MNHDQACDWAVRTLSSDIGGIWQVEVPLFKMYYYRGNETETVNATTSPVGYVDLAGMVDDVIILCEVKTKQNQIGEAIRQLKRYSLLLNNPGRLRRFADLLGGFTCEKEKKCRCTTLVGAPGFMHLIVGPALATIDLVRRSKITYLDFERGINVKGCYIPSSLRYEHFRQCPKYQTPAPPSSTAKQP